MIRALISAERLPLRQPSSMITARWVRVTDSRILSLSSGRSVRGTGELKRPAIQKWVDAGGPPLIVDSEDEITKLVRAYAPHRTITADTTLEELGLSSLERVELMVELEERFNLSIDEATFTKARRLADLVEQISRPAAPQEELTIIDWNRGMPACLVRRVTMAGLILPITHLCARIRVRGAEALRSLDGPVVFASHHQSHLDTAVILAALPSQWRYSVAPAMWKEFFDAHFHPERHSRVRRMTNSLNFYIATLVFSAFPLPQRETGVRETVRHIGDLISEGWSVLIFP